VGALEFTSRVCVLCGGELRQPVKVDARVGWRATCRYAADPKGGPRALQPLTVSADDEGLWLQGLPPPSFSAVIRS
jgi:hypothetical protein